MTAPAVVVLTANGQALGRRIVEALGQGEVVAAQGRVRETLSERFAAGQPLICVMALGIVVRIVGPLAKNKQSDPAVVVVDEAGQFAISVLGGHEGGANELAKEVARALRGTPVITTASDVLGLPALDLIGREWGWKIDGRTHLTTILAAMVRGEPIAVFQNAGRRDWWQAFGEWPVNFHRVEDATTGDWAGLVIISDTLDWLAKRYPCPILLYCPPTLVLGVGCKRGVPVEEIEAHFAITCAKANLSPLCLGMVATADLKADEPGILEFAARHGVPVRTYSLEALGAVDNLPSPSEKVRAKIGIEGVAEAAAMLAATTSQLVVPKVKGARVTMALARREEA